MASSPARPQPWWLDRGTERCALCWETYVYEEEIRCSRCDRGVCRQCAVELRVRHEVVCSDCLEPGEDA